MGGADVHRVEPVDAHEHLIHIGVDRRLVVLEPGDLGGPLLRRLFHPVAAGHHLDVVDPGFPQLLQPAHVGPGHPAASHEGQTQLFHYVFLLLIGPVRWPAWSRWRSP